MTAARPFTATMDDALDHLRLIQWLSPAFPIGGFAYSQGLEQAITDGAVSDAASLRDWVLSVLTHGSGRMDAILLAHARAPETDIDALADLARAYAGSAERAQEMADQGRAFGQTIAAMTGVAQPPLPYAVAVGHATRALAIQTPQVLALFLQGLAGQLIAAAVKFVPLGQTTGQQVLADLGPALLAQAETCATEPLSALGSACFGAELAQMQHQTLDVRIFRS